MRQTLCGFVIVAALGVAPVPSFAAPQAVATSEAKPTITAAARQQALREIIARIQRGYVHMDRRAAIIAGLETSEQQGLYATDDPVEFASRITDDFQRLTNDKHLYLHYLPDWYAAAIAPTTAADAANENAFERKIAHQTNHGLVEMKGAARQHPLPAHRRLRLDRERDAARL